MQQQNISYYIIFFPIIKMPKHGRRENFFIKPKSDDGLPGAFRYDRIDPNMSRYFRPKNRKQGIAYEFAIDHRKSPQR